MSSEVPESVRIVFRFNECINNRNAAGLEALMSADHQFIDSDGTSTSGRDVMLENWRSFFEMWPDYRNEFRECYILGEQVIAVGRSCCSEKLLDGPAIWSARVQDGCVTEWRIWDDTPESRNMIGISQSRRISINNGEQSTKTDH